MSTSTTVPLSRLRIENVALGVLHTVQGIAVLALSNQFSLPVTATFMDGPPGAGPPEISTLFEVRFGWMVAAFLFISALAHFVISAPGVSGWYGRNLAKGRNYARWIEYSVSSSLMIVLIAMLTGIGDVAALGAIAGVNASMILFGLLQEHYERPQSGGWLPFWFGSVAGAVPWVVVGVYLWGPGVDAPAPSFVYAIYVSLFLFFNVFALNMALQYRGVGRWSDYLFGERIYMLLSLTAKSALAWQVFAGTLAG